MAEVIFIYNQIYTTIQCDFKEQMREIIKKYGVKSGIDINSVYFLYSGNLIEENLTFEEIIGQNDKQLNRIKVLVCKLEDLNQYNQNSLFFVKSNNIICPECKEIAFINIRDYKINIYGCKNGHNIKNILLNEFYNTQNIDISKIICENCKINNKGNKYNNLFYKCCN